MCQNCGCSEISPDAQITIDGVTYQPIADTDPTQAHRPDHHHPHHDHHPHDHTHDHEHGHDHPHDHPHTHVSDHSHDHPHPQDHHSPTSEHPSHPTQTLHLATAVLAKNDQIAARNRDRFQAHRVLALNLLSSPGAGKTALLERTFADRPDLAAAVIVGDLATDNDAARLQRVGARAVPIATGNVCHLEAAMIEAALTRLDLAALNVVFIENVGNLVCPAAYDLGEAYKVVLFSVTEGEDKPLKYPTMFKVADVVIITKVDIAEAVGCDLGLARQNIAAVAPQAQVVEVSARSGVGMSAWYDILRQASEVQHSMAAEAIASLKANMTVNTTASATA